MNDPDNTSYEGEWVESDALTGLSDSRDVMMPYLVNAGAAAGDQWVLLIEGDVDRRWQGSHLAHSSGSLDYTFKLSESGEVSVDGSIFTPWRIAGK
jgi:alpha-glucosidase